MFQELRASFSLLALFTLLTGVVYPLLTMGVGQTLFSYQANGSLVEKEGRIIGSVLIGQNFTSARYFHGRPSAAGSGYDASNSSGSNLAPSSKELQKTVALRLDEWREDSALPSVPVDMVTTSGSGLDPDISVAAARLQLPFVAQARALPVAQIEEILAQNTTSRLWGFLGETRVNVLALNLALDALPRSAPELSTEAP